MPYDFMNFFNIKKMDKYKYTNTVYAKPISNTTEYMSVFNLDRAKLVVYNFDV